MLRLVNTARAVCGQVVSSSSCCSAGLTRCRSTTAGVAGVTEEAAQQDVAVRAGAGGGVAWKDAKLHSAVPGPRPLPVLGNAWRFLPVVGEYHGMTLVDVMKSMNADYGPVVKLRGMPGKPELVIISNPNLIEQVLRHEGPRPLRKAVESFNYFMTNMRKHCRNSLVTSEGEEWYEFRTAVNQVVMHPRNTKRYAEPIDRVGMDLVDRMKALRDDNQLMPDDFMEEICKWAMESITYVALDTRLDLLKGDPDPDSEGMKMIQAVHTIFECIYRLDFLPSVWKFVSTPTFRRFIGAMTVFTDVANKYVTLAMERLQHEAASANPQQGDRSYSVLESILLRSEDRETAVAMALDMLFAGVDTVRAQCDRRSTEKPSVC